jgi:cyclophilin family peptidyl-prolyl cis-trans isomerase
MRLLHPSSQKSAVLAACVLACLPAASQAAFTALDALKAEWDRKPPVLDAQARAALPEADRARLDLALARIGAPGAPALLPPWLGNPTREAWEARAKEARTPQDRFTALFFLNRLKSPLALTALAGLNPGDVPAWPASLHLENQVATARINGCALDPDLTMFMNALRGAHKTDPVREEAAHLRLVLAGLEDGEVRMADPTTLAYLDAWNRGPWAKRAKDHLTLLGTALASTTNPGPAQRLLEGLPPEPLPEALPLAVRGLKSTFPLVRIAALDYLARIPSVDAPTLDALKAAAFRNFAGPMCAPFTAALRRHAPAEADRYDRILLGVDDVLALSAAIDDMPAPPANLDALVTRLWATRMYDAVQPFLPALERWKLPEDRRRALLTRFLGHPCWTARLDAYTLLAKVDPATPWPAAPKGGFMEEAILEEARSLVKSGKPVRMRITFEGRGAVVMALDPAVAPINVANLVLLARRKFFDGLTVPRVVPDFVVQMGSPVDSMDGGPGYTVRCEDSLAWYGPGSVGMALSGKDTGGSQFFITTNAAPHLVGKYTRVGTVENLPSALRVLDSLEVGTVIASVEVL